MRQIDKLVYVQMNIPRKIFYNRVQLEKIDRKFLYQSSEKIFKPIRQAQLDQATPGTHNMLKDISA